MRLCRFNTDKLGVIDGDVLRDISIVLDDFPPFRWARPMADPVIAALPSLRTAIEAAISDAPSIDVADVVLDAPVAAPSKIIGAPVNYHAHLEEAQSDHALHQGRVVHPIDEIGCFLKAGSSLVGSGATIARPAGQDRVDYEGEIAVVIGKAAKDVASPDAMEHVAGYALALDMSVRGKQDRSMRKSCDGFSVLGPMTTSDDVADPSRIAFELTINGEVRQAADTSLLIRSVPELIEMCSAFYTLHPGDVIMTGTPAGVGPVVAGDRIVLSSPDLGELTASIQ